MKRYNATLVLTQSDHGAQQPFKETAVYHRQYAETLSQLLEMFRERISLIDTGCIQIWQYSETLGKYCEIGHLYI